MCAHVRLLHLFTLCLAWLGLAWLGLAWLCLFIKKINSEEKTDHDFVMIWSCVVWLCLALFWLGLALLGMALLGFAWLCFCRVRGFVRVHGFMGSWVHGFMALLCFRHDLVMRCFALPCFDLLFC